MTRVEQGLQHFDLVAQPEALGVRAANPGADLDPRGAVGGGVFDDLVHQPREVVGARSASHAARYSAMKLAKLPSLCDVGGKP